MYLFARHILDGNAVDDNVAARKLVKSHQEIDDGRFSRARRTDNGDLHSGLHLRGEIRNDHLIGRIAEMHVLKFHFAADMLLSVRTDKFAGFSALVGKLSSSMKS